MVEITENIPTEQDPVMENKQIFHHDLSINSDSRLSCLVHSVPFGISSSFLQKYYQEFQTLHNPETAMSPFHNS